MAGIAPESFLHAEGELELSYLILVAQKAIEAFEASQKNQAKLTIHYLGQSLGADKKSSGVQRKN